MHYLLLVYSVDPAPRDGLPDDLHAAAGPGRFDLDRQLEASGELVASAALADPSRSRTVHREGTRTLITDGPFAAAEEQLTGVSLVDCDSDERAIEIAASTCDEGLTRVELRPCMRPTGMEM